jgi:hypothetical protein
LQSNLRILQGAGTTASFNGDVAVNLTNTNASTIIQLGNSGTTTYNGNISVVNSGGASGVYFNLMQVVVQPWLQPKLFRLGQADLAAVH